MEKLKFILFSIVVLALIGLLGYWSMNTIQSGTEYVKDQKIKQLEKENKDLKIEIQKQKAEIGAFESELEKLEEPAPTAEKEPEPIMSKYQNLIDELQKLANDNVSLKQKSIGLKVGTVQKFLNIYNNAFNKVDNDYGAGTAKLVAAFQKDSKLSADGEAGKITFLKMIDWLKKQA